MKFTFKSEFVGFGSPTSTLEFESDQIEDVLNYFTQFLKGSGYHFDGYLDIIPHDEDFPPETIEGDEFDFSRPEFPPSMYDEKDVMPMPGTMGGATVTFAEQNQKCKVCGLTSEQLGGHTCYDQRCGLK